MRIASLLLVVLLGPQARAQVAGLPCNQVLRLEAEETALELEISRLVGRWSDANGRGLNPQQSDGSQSPLFVRHGLGGRDALHFDGNDSLTLATGLPPFSYTKVAVVQLDDLTAGNSILSGATDHALLFDASDRARMEQMGTTLVSSVPSVAGEPIILVATFHANTGACRLYQNGVLVASASAARHSDRSLEIGSFGGSQYLRGSIAHLQIHRGVMPTKERMQLEQALSFRYQRGGSRPSITFASIPRDGSLLCRDALDRGFLRVEGDVFTTGYQALRVDIFQDGVPYRSRTQLLTYGGGSAHFSTLDIVAAGLHSYTLKVSLQRNGGAVAVAERRNIVCGDAFLIQGQSNAVAPDFHGEGLANQSQSPWIRSFGSGNGLEPLENDWHWGVAEGELENGHATVGAWGLRMAETLLQDYQVPIALINGGFSSTSIAQHQRLNGDPTNEDTIYGRLLSRALEADVAGGVRALFWHQGESDADNAATYLNLFTNLYTWWLQDYPGLEKIYAFQIRNGCSLVGAGVREIQRLLPDVLPEVRVMATAGVSGHDGCHFFYAGYREIGDNITRLVARDLYGSGDTQNIDPPDLLTAFWTSPVHNRIILTFEDPNDGLIFDSGVEQYFLFDDVTTTAASGTVAGNTITLNLSQTSTATTISYDGHPLDGPWILNARGVGAFTFFDVPIQ